MIEHPTPDPTQDKSGYLTKSQLHKKTGRHPRTLTRDITRAIATSDTELLSLVQLRTKNGAVIEGTTVTADTWKELSDAGDNPAWYLLPEFVEVVCKRNARPGSETEEDTVEENSQRDDSQQETDRPADDRRQGRDKSSDAPPPFPTDPAIRAVVLEHLHYHNQRHEIENRELWDRILNLVETNQGLQAQTNSLLNQFQQELKKQPHGAGVLVGQSQSPNASRNSTETPPEIITIDEQKTAAQKPSPKKQASNRDDSKKFGIKSKKTTAKSGVSKKSSANKKATRPRKTKKSSDSNGKKEEKTTGLWGRFFGSSSK